MIDFKRKILDIVQSSPRRLVLPEGRDIRVVKAAEMIIKERFTTELIILGDPDSISGSAKKEGISLKGIQIMDRKIPKT